MASLLRVPLPKAQELLRDRIDDGSDILQNLAIKANESRYIPLYQSLRSLIAYQPLGFP
jgi:hypothetical protein